MSNDDNEKKKPGVAGIVSAPLTLWLAVAAQFSTLAFWTGTISTRVDDTAKEVVEIRTLNISGRLATLETLARSTDSQLGRIDARLERLLERNPR